MGKNKTIKILIFILILIIIFISIAIKKLKNDENPDKPDLPIQEIEEEVTNYNVKPVTVKNDYFVVKNVINTYNYYCRQLDISSSELDLLRTPLTGEELQKYIETRLEEEKDIAREHIFNMLNKNYIKEFNITKESIQDNFKKDKNYTIDIINNMYVVDNSTNVSTYFVKGISVDKENSAKEEFNICISLDMINNTFCVHPEQYMQKLGYNINTIDIGNYIDINIASIEDKSHNTFTYENINDEMLCEELFNNYKYNSLYNIDKAYNMLDEEYKNNKFVDFEDYKNYIYINKKEIQSSTISKYNSTKQEDFNQYILMDNNERYYIFNVSSINNYKVILDTYTIDLPEFIEKYNKASEIEKVGYNIQKVIEAINNKDYSYVYNKLDNSFKKNNYNTLESFKKYIQSNLFERNIISSDVTTSQEGYIYIYDISIKNANNSNEKKKMTVIMQLKEGTDFVMSFDIK